MRIMKHGNRPYFHETEYECKTCGCLFRFSLADISLKLEYSADADKYTSCNYVVCPECKTAYILNQKEESGNTADPETTDPDPGTTDPNGGTDPSDPGTDPDPNDP